MNPCISINNVRVRLGTRTVVDDVSYDIQEGKTVAVIGPSGAGKTTLLRCLNALVPVNNGNIRINDFTITNDSSSVDLRALREQVGMVFQQFNLWPHRTVLQNIIDAPMRVKGKAKEDAEKMAHALLDRVGMTERADDFPSSLSGGQQQRVAIARALAMEPKVLLFDEITSSLDPELTSDVLRVIRNISTERKRTIMIVTHEMEFARHVADDILFMDNGKIVEHGSPSDILDHPREKRTQQFLRKFILS